MTLLLTPVVITLDYRKYFLWVLDQVLLVYEVSVIRVGLLLRSCQSAVLCDPHYISVRKLSSVVNSKFPMSNRYKSYFHCFLC